MQLRALLRLALPSAVAASIGAAIAVPITSPSDESVEPGARYALTIDGTTVAVRDDRPFEITLGERTLTGTLEPLPTKELVVGGVRFEYPRAMSFEYETGFGADIWTLDGNDATVMVFRFSVGLGLEEMLDDQIEAFSDFGEVETSDATVRLGEREVAGAQITVASDMIGALAMELYPLDEGEESRLWIMLQDVRDAPDAASDEFVEVRDMVARTFGPVL